MSVNERSSAHWGVTACGAYVIRSNTLWACAINCAVQGGFEHHDAVAYSMSAQHMQGMQPHRPVLVVPPKCCCVLLLGA
jgi:hypothetical protein